MFCFNKIMSFQILTRQPVEFYEKNGVKFFKPFVAVDKFKRPVNVFFDKDSVSTIVAENHTKDYSFYELSFNPKNKTMIGQSLNAEPSGQGLGEILNLSALIEFHKNNLNRFKVFSLKEAIQFYARYGFKVVSDDKDFILKNLKNVIDEKSPLFVDLKRSAEFFAPRIEGKIKTSDPYISQRANNVFSAYLKELSRKHQDFDSSKINHSTNMEFTDWENLTNRDYLNSLLDEHKINYQV